MGYLLESLENGWSSVFLPQAPTPMSGNVMYLPADRVRPLDITMVDAMAIIKAHRRGIRRGLRGVDLKLPSGPMTEPASQGIVVPGRSAAGSGTLAARPRHVARIPSFLAAPRHRCRNCSHDHAGARRHCLCGRFRPAGSLWAVRHDHPADRLRRVRPQPHPGPGPRFLARTPHPRRGGGTVCVGSCPSRGHRRRPGHRVRPGLHPGRRAEAGLHHRTPVQADPIWLHERHRPYRADQPAAQAARLFHRGRRAVAQPARDRHGDLGRQDQLDFLWYRRRRAGSHPAAERQQAAARRADRGDRCHRGRQHFRFVGAGRGGARPFARGLAGLRRSLDRGRRPRPGAGRRRGDRAGFFRRHERAVSRLCRAPRPSRQFQPGDGGSWGGQPRRRPVSGLSDQQQRIANAGGGSGRRQDAGYRRGRRAGRGRVAGGRTRSPEASADARSGCRGHRFGDRVDRGRRPAGASGVSSAGSSGCPSCAWSAWRCWAPFRASGWPW